MLKYALSILSLLLVLTPGLVAEDLHYSHDDGSSDACYGGSPMDRFWLQYYDPQGGSDIITHVSTVLGRPGGSTEPTGSLVVHVYVWDDPNNDGDPSDAVLLGQGWGYARNYNSDEFTHYELDEPVTVTSRFFVGAKVSNGENLWPMPLDNSQASQGRAWSGGSTLGTFNPEDLMDNSLPPEENDASVYPGTGVWMLRAHRFSPEVDGQSFDYTSNTSLIRGWTEVAGDWLTNDRRLAAENVTSNQVITRDGVLREDGCIEFRGIYGDGASLRYIGAVLRYLSGSDRVMVKVQDNAPYGDFDSVYLYDGALGVLLASGEDFGAEPLVQVTFSGSELDLRIDVDDDGIWDHHYERTLTTVQDGAVGLAAFGPCLADDWYCGPRGTSWGGTTLSFEPVPQTYWAFAGAQNLGDYYDGVTFGPDLTIYESTIYGYSNTVYPWHSSDAVASPMGTDPLRIDFDEEKTHVGLWYTMAMGDAVAEAFDAGGYLLDSAVMFECSGRNGYLSLDAEGISYVTVTKSSTSHATIDDVEYRPIKYNSPTVGSAFSSSVTSGSLPFYTTMRAEMFNLYDEQIRRLAGRIDVTLGNGTFYANWRNGFTNLTPQSAHTIQWNQFFPPLPSVAGHNIFTLTVEDVTPSPYNQPPYPAAGHSLARAVVVTANP